MSNPWVVIVVTTAIVALSAFFVAVEFALLAAKRHRLEDAAATSRAARAALRSASELSLLLAGAQLGITMATLALGAITKPAVHHWLTPLLESTGAPYVLADVASFVLALIFVTFLHLVVGEMMPKSWAIAHPESSAIALALPMRAFMAATRPILVVLNHAANWCLRRVGVDPVDHVAVGQDAEALRHLVEHSANVGALDPAFSTQLASVLDLGRVTVADLLARAEPPAGVTTDATVSQLQAEASRSGHLRILVGPPGGEPTGFVHVRDTLLTPGDRPVGPLARDLMWLEAGMPLHAALSRMRETRTHLAAVRLPEGGYAIVTLTDVLASLFPEESAGLVG